MTEQQNVDVSLTVHLSITLVNEQLDAQFFYFIIRLLQSSTCFELIIGRSDCIITASGIVTFCKWPSGAQVERILSQPVQHYIMFITVLYMFQATSCSSSGGHIVLIQHLV